MEIHHNPRFSIKQSHCLEFNSQFQKMDAKSVDTEKIVMFSKLQFVTNSGLKVRYTRTSETCNKKGETFSYKVRDCSLLKQ